MALGIQTLRAAADMTTYTSQDLDRIVRLAGALADKGVALSEKVHAQLSGTPTKGDLRSRSIYFAAITAHDLELGIRVVKEMLFNQFWDLLYQPSGAAMYPGASVKRTTFKALSNEVHSSGTSRYSKGISETSIARSLRENSMMRQTNGGRSGHH